MHMHDCMTNHGLSMQLGLTATEHYIMDYSVQHIPRAHIAQSIEMIIILSQFWKIQPACQEHTFQRSLLVHTS
jgi:hypothetical protein